MSFTVKPVPFGWVQPTNAMSPALTCGTIGEKASQTFKDGTPLDLSTGYYEAWGGTDPAGLPVIVGISLVGGLNLTTAGVAQPSSWGSVPNQSTASNFFMTGPIPTPTPFAGNIFALFGAGNIFTGLFGNNGSNQLPALTDVGVPYGLTLDSGTGYWYVDKNKATSGTNTAVVIVGLDFETSANGTNITTSTLVKFVAQNGIAIPVN